jgi:hypothetical protein
MEKNKLNLEWIPNAYSAKENTAPKKEINKVTKRTHPLVKSTGLYRNKKVLTVILMLLIYGIANAQLKPLQSITWVSDNLGTLNFLDEGLVRVELDQSFKLYPRILDIGSFKYYLSKDTLVVVNPYPEATFIGQAKHSVVYKFIMTRKGNETLSLSPVNDEAKQMIPQFSYVLRNIIYVNDPAIKFTSIHVDVGGFSEGTPPVSATSSEHTVNIDNKGNYYSKILSNGFRSPANYFKGKLNAGQLDSLNYFVQHSEIKKLQNWKEILRADHAAQWNVVIAYNSDMLKLNANILPGVTNDLLRYIMLLAKKLTLEPDEQRHDFKDEHDLNYYK